MFRLKNILTCTSNNDDADENVNIEEANMSEHYFDYFPNTPTYFTCKFNKKGLVIRLQNRRSSLVMSTAETLIWPFHGVVLIMTT